MLINHTDIRCHRVAITIARVFESIYLKPEPNYSPITDEGKSINTSMLTSYEDFVKVWVRKRFKDKEWFNRLSTKIDKVISTTKKGPNGPALLYSHYDLIALNKDSRLLEDIYKLNGQCSNSWINQMMTKNFKPNDITGSNFTHSRINYVSEGGGKTRIFAIGDYWSQMSLKGIHNVLMELLFSLKTDATKDQQRGFERVLNESLNKQAYCFDLSGASDRIPLLFQEILLKYVFNKNISKCWSSVIANRKFQTPEGEYISWKVGQPLGLLSSWPAFALWHHSFVQYCAFRCNIYNFQEYQILGDDVVIWNKRVGDIYLQFMKEIGIPINFSKSVISCNGYTQIEFAKRIAINGVEISGIKHHIISKNELTFVNPLLENMYERNLLMHTPGYIGINYFKSSRRNNLLRKIIDTRIRLLRTECADNSSHVRAYLTYLVKEIRKELILKKVAKLDNLLSAVKPLDKLFDKARCQVNQTQLGNSGYYDPESLHPLVWAINAQGEELAIALDRLWDDESDSAFPIEYLPIVGNEQYFRSRKMKESQWFTSTLIQAYDKLYNGHN